ncbi:integrase, catalytic region, zinc finger, CCHC-type containing protein [Tanacetum coccineum]
MNSIVCQPNTSVLNTKTINGVNDDSNIVCVSCSKDVFLLSHEKYVARYALSRDSKVKRALFTTLITTKSNNLGATSVVLKSRLSVAKTPTATNKVSSVLPLSPDSRTLSNYMKNKIATSRKWQKWFEYQQYFNWTPKSKTAQSQSSQTKSDLARTVRFGNDHFVAIIGYGDYVQGNLTICHVYYVEGLGHNLFSIGQFCNRELEVAFRSNTCYVWNLEGDDLLTGSRESNLYTISISKLAASSPVCLMSKATSTKSWFWHQRLSHLNFGTINQLTSNDLVDGLPKFKYNKDHLCSAREQGKSKKASLPPKLIPSIESKLELIHIDLCGPIRVASINGKKYILVIVDDYSRSLCYPTNDRDDLGKRKLKADIGIFISYSESSRGFCIYNHQSKKIIEMIHVKFDELIAMASECNNSEPGFNCMIFQDTSEDSQSAPSKTDLDNLFGPLYEEYYATSPPEVSDNSTTNTLDNDGTSSLSSIVVEEDEAPQIVSSSAEQVASEPNTPVLNDNADKISSKRRCRT